MKQISVNVIPSFPLIEAGDDIGQIILDAADKAELKIEDGDILVIAQKVISKSEGRLVKLEDITPSQEAHDLAIETEKDPRLVQLILNESSRVVRKKLKYKIYTAALLRERVF